MSAGVESIPGWVDRVMAFDRCFDPSGGQGTSPACVLESEAVATSPGGGKMPKSPEEMAAAMIANMKEKTGKTLDRAIIVLLILAVASLAILSFNPFIYFRF